MGRGIIVSPLNKEEKFVQRPYERCIKGGRLNMRDGENLLSTPCGVSESLWLRWANEIPCMASIIV